RPHDQRRSSPLKASAENRVQLGDAARHLARLELRLVLRRDEAWKNDDAACHDAEIMKPLAIRDAAKLQYSKPPVPNDVVARKLFEPQRPVRDALELEVAMQCGEVVEHNYRAPQAVEEPF